MKIQRIIFKNISREMKKLSLQFGLLLAISLISFSSCLKDNDGPPNDSIAGGIMYFVNAYPDAPHGLVYTLGGRMVGNPYTGEPMVLDYRTYSHPQLLYPGNRELVITGYNLDQEVIIDTTLAIKVDTVYTSFVYGTTEERKFAMTQDRTIENLGENESGIRFLNLAEGVESVNLLIEGEEEPLFTDRPIETGASVVENQDFQAHNSGTYTFKVTDSEGNELVVRDDASQLESRYYYTIMLTGKKDDADTPLYIGVIKHR